MKKNGESILVERLKSSTMKVGKLYPVLEDFHGNVIDGKHRLEADGNWPRMRLENVKTEKERIVARLISNACRRSVTAQEKTEMLDKLGEILHEERVQPGEISKMVAEETGMSYTWVMKYLSEKFRDEKKAPHVTRRVTSKMTRLLELSKPPNEEFVEMSKYANTQHTIYTIKRSLQEKVERVAEMLKTTPEILLQNIIEEKVREIKALIDLTKAPRKKLASATS